MTYLKLCLYWIIGSWNMLIYNLYTTNTYYFVKITCTVPKLESTNQRKGGNVVSHMRSHFDSLSFRSKKETWLQIITLDLLMVVRNMGMYNHMWMLKYRLQFRNTMQWNFHVLVMSYSKGNNKILRRVCISLTWKCKLAVRLLGLLPVPIVSFIYCCRHE
jgi:hypothetical protein